MTADAEPERLTDLRDDNARLRRLLDQRDAPGELRHRLRSTLALLRAIIRRSADPRRDLQSYVAHLEDRLDAIARAQSYADQHGEVDLRTLIADELMQYDAFEGEKVALSGPGVRLQPRAGQILALAVHELAVNAVEHGSLGGDGGRVDVTWNVADTGLDQSVSLAWAEYGLAQGTGCSHHGFGMEVLTRMLAYDLGAEASVTFTPEGIRCSIHLPLSALVGRIVPG